MFDTDGTWWLDSYDIDDIIDKGYWETKDGKRLKITNMETSHIENCIKMLEKTLYMTQEEDEYIDFKLEELREELDKRPGGGQIEWN